MPYRVVASFLALVSIACTSATSDADTSTSSASDTTAAVASSTPDASTSVGAGTTTSATADDGSFGSSAADDAAADTSVDTGVDATSDTGTTPVATYSTDFDVDENPLSEGGVWIHQDPLLTPCKSVGGIAFGTQTGAGVYDDSNVYITGVGDDHEVEGVVWLDPNASDGPNREVEILLRWSDDGPLRATEYGDTHANGYEINWSHRGYYLNLGRFKGALLKSAPSVPTPQSGDRFRARIEGQHIQVWINDVLQMEHTDDEPDLAIAHGNPGIGFYIDAGAPNDEFGFDSVSVRAL